MMHNPDASALRECRCVPRSVVPAGRLPITRQGQGEGLPAGTFCSPEHYDRLSGITGQTWGLLNHPWLRKSWHLSPGAGMNIQDRSERNFRGPDAPAPILMPDARLATIYEQAGVGIVEVDDEARILRVNEQVCRLTGYAPLELLGRTVFQETLPEDVDIDRAQFERQRAGE